MIKGQLGNFQNLGRKFLSLFGVIGGIPEVAIGQNLYQKPVLVTVSGLKAEDKTAVRMLHFYEMILNGADLSALVREADKLKAQARTNVI